MVRIAVTGAGGRMGKTLIEAIAQTESAQLTAAIERPESSLLGADAGELAGVGKNGVAVVADLSSVINEFDVLIDFSIPSATLRNVATCGANGKRIVIGTTGFTADEKQQLQEQAAKNGAVMAAN